MRTETSLRRGKYLLAYLLTYSQREEEREDLLLLFFFFLTRGEGKSRINTYLAISLLVLAP